MQTFLDLIINRYDYNGKDSKGLALIELPVINYHQN